MRGMEEMTAQGLAEGIGRKGEVCLQVVTHTYWESEVGTLHLTTNPTLNS